MIGREADGPLWAVLLLGAMLAVLGRSWPLWGRSWLLLGFLGRSWAALGHNPFAVMGLVLLYDMGVSKRLGVLDVRTGIYRGIFRFIGY